MIAIRPLLFSASLAALLACGGPTPVDPPSPLSAQDGVSAAPTAPSGLVATAGVSRINLTWNAGPESDIAYYNVYRGDFFSSPSAPLSLYNTKVILTNCSDINVFGGRTYHSAVTAVNKAGLESARSNSIFAKALIGVNRPSRPVGVAAIPGNGYVRVDWVDHADPGVSSYNVYRTIVPNGASYSLVAGGLTESDFTDTTVTGGVTYYYVVTAVNIGGEESLNSTQVSATPPGVVIPSPPTGLAASPGDRLVALDWNDNRESDLAFYRVFRSTSHGYGYLLVGNNVYDSSYVDHSAINGVTYYYVVVAVDMNGYQSGFSNEVIAVPQ